MKGLTVGLEGAVGTSRSPPEKNEGKKRVACMMHFSSHGLRLIPKMWQP